MSAQLVRPRRIVIVSLGAIYAVCFSLVSGPTTLERAIADAKELLADSAEQLARLRASAGVIAQVRRTARRSPRQDAAEA